MGDVSIDVSGDDCDELICVENAELSWIRVSLGSATIEMRWEQAEALFNKLRPFFVDEPEQGGGDERR